MELTVGDKRTFTHSKTVYRIREVLNNPGISMWWNWTTGVCPHCKKRIERNIEHIFYRIEILGDDTKDDKSLTIDDIVLMGDTLDKRRMTITKDKYNEIFNASNDFKHLVR